MLTEGTQEQCRCGSWDLWPLRVADVRHSHQSMGVGRASWQPVGWGTGVWGTGDSFSNDGLWPNARARMAPAKREEERVPAKEDKAQGALKEWPGK